MLTDAASRSSLSELRNRLGSAVPSLPGQADAYRQLAADLYSVSDLLASQPRLRRTLGDSSTSGDGRAELARGLLTGKIGDTALDLVTRAAGLRWSSPWDLADSLEILGDDALLATAEQQDELDAVEDELFRFERILSGSGELVAAFDEAGVPAPRRRALLDSVLAGKVNPITAELLGHAVTSGRKQSLLLAIDDLLQASASRRNRSVARVISATELTGEQSSRLAAALTTMYGREITIRSAVDSDVRGGLLVRVGDEVIDGTIASRLAAARSAFAS